MARVHQPPVSGMQPTRVAVVVTCADRGEAGGIEGIGPWTAAVILLRALGRLDVFPAEDSSVARNAHPRTGDDCKDTERDW